MKKRIAALIATAGTLAWLVAQNTGGPSTLSVYFPNDAVFYIETPDLAKLLSDWSASPEKVDWLKSDNYEVFSRSRLFQRLGTAQEEFQKALIVAPDMSLLNAFAGGQSALAIYDIGKLEFLYITRMPGAKALETALWKARTSYQTRQAGGVEFYVRTDGDSKRVAAFATTKELVLLSTREDLIAGALALLAAPGQGLNGDPWFAEATQAGKAPGEIRMVLNMDALVKSPQFRSYWIQRNASELKPFRSGVIDLFREQDQIREERILIRNQQVPRNVNEAAAGRLVSFVPPNAGFYRVWASPGVFQVRDLLYRKLVAPGPAMAESQIAPNAADPDRQVGNAGDLEVRIDEPSLDTSALHPSLSAISTLLAGKTIDAVLQLQSAAPQGVFVETPCAVLVTVSGGTWNGAEARAALSGALVQVRGNVLVAATSQPMLDSVLARIAAPGTSQSAAYAAAFEIQKELPLFSKMMRSLDTARRGAQGDGGEPDFFSRNVASLGTTMKRFTAASIVMHDDGARVPQTVVYRMVQ